MGESLKPAYDIDNSQLYKYCEQQITEYVGLRCGQKTMSAIAQDFAERYGQDHPLLGYEPALTIVKSMMGTELDLNGYRTVMVREPHQYEFPDGFTTQAQELLEAMTPMTVSE